MVFTVVVANGIGSNLELQDRQACSVDEGDDAALSRRNNQTRKIGEERAGLTVANSKLLMD
jgi:hypothetical protein